MTKIKLCGLRCLADIHCANRLLPAYVGYVFAAASRRAVRAEQAAALTAALDPRITPVGVFVDSPVTEIAALCRVGTIRVIQLHGQQTDADVAALRALTDCPIVQAYRIDTAADVARAAQTTADYPLLDHGAGGTGETFDWALLHGFPRPFFLAGGLGADNVAAAIACTHPYAVDASSSLETDGGKDFTKMTRFVAAVRGSAART